MARPLPMLLATKVCLTSIPAVSTSSNRWRFPTRRGQLFRSSRPTVIGLRSTAKENSRRLPLTGEYLLLSVNFPLFLEGPGHRRTRLWLLFPTMAWLRSQRVEEHSRKFSWLQRTSSIPKDRLGFQGGSGSLSQISWPFGEAYLH